MKWNHAIIDYQHYLKIERGLSANSISSYSNDVKKLMRFINENEMDVNPINIDHDTIHQFIYHISQSVNARTQARQISGLRNFFDYLIFED